MDAAFPECTPMAQSHDFPSLVDFYYSRKGIDWSNQNGWREGIQDPYSDPCGWYGIVCDSL